MFIRKLQLTNFKNHTKQAYSFHKNIIAFVGLNGVGKTNILDALYFLCIGKSYFSTTDKNCIKENELFFRIEQNISLNSIEENEVIIVLEKDKRKKIILNDNPIDKLTELMGKFPVVIVAPNDNMLVLGGSTERRKFLDYTLSITDMGYLNNIIQYNHYLKQRNALLKIDEGKQINESLLEIYNVNLVKHGIYIYEKRQQFVKDLLPFFIESYSYLTTHIENYGIEYESHLLKENFEKLLSKSLKSDIYLKRTTKGIHKDELNFIINSKELKEFGSQGQQKTFILALKLSQYNFIKSKLNKSPIFIIDDIFDKLDTKRSQKLISYLLEQNSQVFISNTSKETLNVFANEDKLQIIEVVNE